MFEKDLRLVPLFDLYGELLSESQKNMFDLYYNDDLSLAEIAEHTGITRQGVRDSIKRAEEFLLATEKKLGFAEKNQQINRITSETEEKITALKVTHPELAEVLDDILAHLQALPL